MYNVDCDEAHSSVVKNGLPVRDCVPEEHLNGSGGCCCCCWCCRWYCCCCCCGFTAKTRHKEAERKKTKQKPRREEEEEEGKKWEALETASCKALYKKENHRTGR